ncbi:MAG: hypothetical protein HRU05_12065 [Oceanospirillaceae bacterium]|nr:hypothetical protein [Oceanospirillaceae bacterium]
MRNYRGLTLLCCFFAHSLLAKTITLTQNEQQDLTISLYSTDLALVQDRRLLGPLLLNDTVIVSDISQQMHPQSLQINGAGNIIEQSLNRQVLSYQSLIDTHIGKQITLAKSTPSGIDLKQQVTLLSADKNRALVEYKGSIETIWLNANQWRLIFPVGSEQLALKPSLSFKTQGRQSTGNISLNYLTSGLHWQMDYVFELNQSRDKLQLKGLASLFNNTSTAFSNASINLIAGNISLPKTGVTRAKTRELMSISQSAPGLPNAENIGDLKRYRLKQRITLLPQQQTQVPLINATDIPVETSYRYSATITPYLNNAVRKSQVDSYIAFSNNQQSGLGIALPRGQVRVFNSDTEGDFQFIGASIMRASSINQQIELSTGKAFDLSVTQRQTNNSETFDGSIIDTQFMINNSSKQRKTLRLSTRFNQHWEIISSTYPVSEKQSANAVWLLDIAANSSLVFSLKVRLKHRK